MRRKRPRGVYCVAGAFSEETIWGLLPPPTGRYKRNKKKSAAPLMRTQQQLRLRNDYRVGTGDAAAVAGVGIADGSRAEYDVGIRCLLYTSDAADE